MVPYPSVYSDRNLDGPDPGFYVKQYLSEGRMIRIFLQRLYNDFVMHLQDYRKTVCFALEHGAGHDVPFHTHDHVLSQLSPESVVSGKCSAEARGLVSEAVF